jgi:hypothetical protein
MERNRSWASDVKCSPTSPMYDSMNSTCLYCAVVAECLAAVGREICVFHKVCWTYSIWHRKFSIQQKLNVTETLNRWDRD